MNRIVDAGESYLPYRNLPPLAGLVKNMSEAIKNHGLRVEEVVTRFKRFHYGFKRLHQIFNDHIPSEPIYELKMAFSLHAHLCAEHVGAVRKRISEMREPPLGLGKVPHPALETFFDEILKTPSTEERLAAIYEVAIPALIRGFERHQKESHPLADQPSLRVGKFALLELGEMAAYGAAAVPCLVDEEKRNAMLEWLAYLQNLLAQAGDLDGTQPPMAPEAVRRPERLYSDTPYQIDVVVRRDERFFDPYNMGVNAEAYLYEPAFDEASKVLMMFYKRLREIDVPEMMATIVGQTKGKPWPYYQEMTRQLWDEARHAMMGEIGFISLGIDWKKVPINFTWSLGLNTQLKPLERHAVLYFIEQGLMPKTGKRYEWEVGVASQHPLAGLFQDFDWADEVLHAHIGRNWYLSEMPGAKEAIDYGDACWSKVLMDWGAWQREGKTAHRNWWPEIYQTACQKAGVAPREDQLAYATSYQKKRADLKMIPAE
ncbi:MAG: hypothetical protein ACR2OZ_06780 [Verrucomicrobiales bacterium]